MIEHLAMFQRLGVLRKTGTVLRAKVARNYQANSTRVGADAAVAKKKLDYAAGSPRHDKLRKEACELRFLVVCVVVTISLQWVYLTISVRWKLVIKVCFLARLLVARLGGSYIGLHING